MKLKSTQSDQNISPSNKWLPSDTFWFYFLLIFLRFRGPGSEYWWLGYNWYFWRLIRDSYVHKARYLINYSNHKIIKLKIQLQYLVNYVFSRSYFCFCVECSDGYKPNDSSCCGGWSPFSCERTTLTHAVKYILCFFFTSFFTFHMFCLV